MKRLVVRSIHRLFGATRHRAVDGMTGGGSIASLGGRHCAVATFRRDGTPVVTPVWFGTAGGRVYFRAESVSGKAKRLERDPRVLVAPCTKRGKPVGPAFAGTARRLAGDEASDAEATIQRAFGLGRRLYERWFTLPDGVYVEVTPDPAGQATMPPSTGMTAPVR